MTSMGSSARLTERVCRRVRNRNAKRSRNAPVVRTSVRRWAGTPPDSMITFETTPLKAHRVAAESTIA
jgi:hypothetical protein